MLVLVVLAKLTVVAVGFYGIVELTSRNERKEKELDQWLENHGAEIIGNVY